MSDIRCFHCSLPVPEPVQYFARVDGEQQPVCCPGCKAVTEAIVNGGLDSYYQHRTMPGQQARSSDLKLREELAIYDRPEIQADFVQNIQNDEYQANLLIEGITCAACIWLLEQHIASIPGVEQVNVNLSTHEAMVTWHSRQTRLSTILLEIHRIGYQAFPWRADRHEALLKKENRLFIRRLAVAGIGTMQVMMYAIALYSGAISNDMAIIYRDFIRFISAIVATPVVFYAAAPFFRAAFRDLRTRHLSMDFPVSIAIGGAYIASLWATAAGHGEVYFDSVSMFTFFLLTGRYLEFRVRHKTTLSARSLANLIPASCLKKVSGHFIRTPVVELQKDDYVRILPGEVIPADGTLVEGSSSVNESMLTGEYMPVPKQPGASLLCGSINTDNAIEMQVTRTGKSTRMGGIIQLLQRARHDKPAIARLSDRIAGWFVGFVVLTAAAVYWHWFGQSSDSALWITLSVLVVTCPCALSLATPAALTAATGQLHKLGLLVTRGHVLEGLNQIDHIIFDKTGTLTRGELSVCEVLPVDLDSDKADHYKALASALEAHSEHPIANAFDTTTAMPASNIRTNTGQGLEGHINGTDYRIGKASFAWPKQPLTSPRPLDSGCCWLTASSLYAGSGCLTP